ncbi:MAG TPA: BNR repeat-containing protein [Roseimicrobium sp.]|nr:BNR repeat-containing protein [Roseimicrobium sp.]
MHTFVFIFTLFLLASFVRANTTSRLIADQVVDRVWSGHPVGFAFLTERGHQFIAYYDAERRITVAGRRLDGGDWTHVHPEGVPHPRASRATNVTGWDSHNYLTLALDRDGYLHLSGNMHNDPLVYYRTRRPLDVTSFERLDCMIGNREDNTTYPVFFKTAAGDLLFRYRDGGSGNGSDLYNRYDPATRAWTRLLDTPLLDGQGRRNAYALPPVLGPDGRFHLVWMWRETPDCATNHTLSYARSADFIHWEKTDGTPIQLPITLDNAEVVDPAPIRRGLINMTFSLGFDAQRRPIVVYHRYDDQNRSQAYAARPGTDATGWTRTPLSTWNFQWQFSGGGSIAPEVTLGTPVLQTDGTLIVDFETTHPPGNGRWQVAPATLTPVATLPAPASALPADLLVPESTQPGLEVQTLTSRADGRLWVLRWETLPRNRDRPRKQAPPSSRLRLIELPDNELSRAIRVGS